MIAFFIIMIQVLALGNYLPTLKHSDANFAMIVFDYPVHRLRSAPHHYPSAQPTTISAEYLATEALTSESLILA